MRKKIYPQVNSMSSFSLHKPYPTIMRTVSSETLMYTCPHVYKDSIMKKKVGMVVKKVIKLE